MYDRYIITGATGFLGRAVAEELVRRGAQVYALVLDNDPYKALLPKEVKAVTGDVCTESTLASLFEDADSRTCVIHCAGIVSVASRPGATIYQVNVGGTRNIIRQCTEHGVGRLIYISSVHAIPEKPFGRVMTEDCILSPGLVDGEYAKSKASATELVFDAAQHGLSASGILACAESGESGKGYILSGHYATIRKMLRMLGKTANVGYRPLCLPLWLAKLAAPYYEKHCLKGKKPLFFTPYSIAVLASNGHFSHAAASECFAYQPRPMEETLRDMASWLLKRE